MFTWYKRTFGNYAGWIKIRNDGKEILLNLSYVKYITGSDRKTVVHLVDETIEVNTSVSDFWKLIGG